MNLRKRPLHCICKVDVGSKVQDYGRYYLSYDCRYHGIYREFLEDQDRWLSEYILYDTNQGIGLIYLEKLMHSVPELLPQNYWDELEEIEVYL